MGTKAMAADLEKEGVAGQVVAGPQRFFGFLTDVRNEMRKVTTPSAKEVQATTVVVIITVALFGMYFYGVDFVLGRAIDWLLKAGR